MFNWFSLFVLVNACLGLFCVIAWINVLFAPRLRWASAWAQSMLPATQMPLVSVLVPARNEAHQIADSITALLASDYPHLEVIVADDQSSDGTAQVLEQLATRHPRGSCLRTLRLEGEPPRGWLGKVRACDALQQLARGEILIFCDADVFVTKFAVSNTVVSLMRYQADALTGLPTQLGGSPLTQAIVAAVTQFSILITLPLSLVPRISSPALAMGNGQWFAWRRPAYLACDGHAAVRASRIEDVELGRRIKGFGYKLLVVQAIDDLTVRMYNSRAEARQGFRKNLFALAGESWLAVLAMVLLLVAVFMAPWLSYLYLGSGYAAATLGLEGAVILAQRMMFGTSWRVICYLPLGLVFAIGYLVESAYWTQRGQLFWKDRAI